MKLHPGKFLIILIVFGIMLYASFSNYLKDDLRPLRIELQNLYAIKFERNTITSIVERHSPYPVRGNYTLFKVDTSHSFYPILLQNGRENDYELFKKGVKISKEENSCEILLEVGSFRHHINISKPEDFDDRIRGSFVWIFFFGSFIGVLFFVPNSYFKKYYLNKNSP